MPYTRHGSGVPLVILPGVGGRNGLPARLRRWLERREVAELAKFRTVWRIERRRGLKPETSIADLAAESAEIIRSLFATPVDVVGISTGGSIALQLAADHPELVRRLVLVSAVHRLSDHGRSTQRTVAALLRARRPRRAAAALLADTGSGSIGATLLTVVGFIAPRVVVGHRDHDLVVTLDAEENFDLEKRLSQIRALTLIAAGAKDRFYSAELFESAARMMPRATLTIYPRLGHLGLQSNVPLAADILRFLAPGEDAN